MDKLFILTAQADADITTGKGTDINVPPPAGNLFILHGVGKGQRSKKPCIGC